MKKYKYYLLAFLLLVLTNASFGSTFMVCANVGQSMMSDDFENSLSFGGKIAFAAKEGFVLEGSASYLNAESDTIPELKAAIGLASLSYMLPLRSQVKPYVGGSAGLSLLNSYYDSPAFTYGAKGGFMLNVSKDTKVYIEASKLWVDSSVSNVAIEPLSISFGLGIAFGGYNAKIGTGGRPNKGFNNRRRPGKNRKKPRPRGRR